MIKITDQYFWNFVFLIFFLFLVTMGAIILETESRIPYADLTLIDFLLLTLATWRLTRMFIYDTITKFFREQFWDLVKVGKGFELEKPKFGPRRTLADLLSCSWCVSTWAAASLIFFYLLTPYAVFPIIILALSAVASFLQLASSALGYKVEKLKKENGD